jgi:hypothetical protein
MRTKPIGIMIIAGAALSMAGFMGITRERDLVVHEWGTFTSLQGSDGLPIKWNPLESSGLPRFVYDWNHQGLGRYPSGLLGLGSKSVLVTLQRMETPVVYFYTDRDITLDLTVSFPKGGITEWYPQAAEIGPCRFPPGPVISKLDSGLHSCGVSPSFTLDSFLNFRNVKASFIRWHGLKILPTGRHPEVTGLLPTDSSGSHYFAARETDSAYVQVPSESGSGSQSQCEKFLFYRGVGNFATPLSVSMRNEGAVTIANTGSETISHLLVLGIDGKAGAFVYLDELKPGARTDATLDLHRRPQPLATLRTQIEEQMAHSLTAEGLFAREATAMVKTWADSWFTEQGVRVLYILPRAWTEETLSMRVEPRPKQLVRVMVGRAELITPETEKELNLELTEARQRRVEAEGEIRGTVAKLGRFAGPVFGRALDRADLRPAERDELQRLLFEIQRGIRR